MNDLFIGRDSTAAVSAFPTTDDLSQTFGPGVDHIKMLAPTPGTQKPTRLFLLGRNEIVHQRVPR